VEKMRVFEKTFGIDQLNTMVKKLEHQMKVSFPTLLFVNLEQAH
jgi:hypothetical protein